MPTPDSRYTPARVRKRAALTLACGLALLAISFLPALTAGQERWTKDRAQAYQDASMKIQQLTHQLGRETPETASRATSEEFQKALADFDELKVELVEARGRKGFWASALRLSGIALAAVAAARWLAAGKEA